MGWELETMHALPPRNSVIAIYSTHTETEAAIRRLLRSRFDIRKLSVAAKDRRRSDRVVGYFNTGDRMKYWGELWTFWDVVWGLLPGWAFFSIPGIGPMLVAGPLAGWIVLGLENATMFGGLDPLAAGLYNIGIPRGSLSHYEAALQAGKFLIIAHGAADEVERARQVLGTDGATKSPAVGEVIAFKKGGSL